MLTDNQTVYKTKIIELNQGDNGLKIRISKKILEDIDAKPFDRFTLSRNPETGDIIFTKNIEGNFKLKRDGAIYVPYILHEKRWILANKTAILFSSKKEGKIILKFIN